MVFTGLTKMTTKAARKCRIWTTRMTSPTTTSTTAEAVPETGKTFCPLIFSPPFHRSRVSTSLSTIFSATHASHLHSYSNINFFPPMLPPFHSNFLWCAWATFIRPHVHSAFIKFHWNGGERVLIFSVGENSWFIGLIGLAYRVNFVEIFSNQLRCVIEQRFNTIPVNWLWSSSSISLF
jgi:hypothetical protein